MAFPSADCKRSEAAAEEDAAAAEGEEEDAVEKDEPRRWNMCGWEQREAALVSRASVFFVASQSVDLVQAHLLPALTLTHQIILITNEAAWWGDGGGGGRQGRRPAFSQWDSVNFRYRGTVSGESPPPTSPPSASYANPGSFNKVQRWFARGLSFENRRFSVYLLCWYKLVVLTQVWQSVADTRSASATHPCCPSTPLRPRFMSVFRVYTWNVYTIMEYS